MKRIDDNGPLSFAANDKVEKYGQISSDFFRLVGLGDVVFISNDSRLSDVRDTSAPGRSLGDLYTRIRDLYGVDVAGLDVLTEIFARIEAGPAYQNWLKSGSRERRRRRPKRRYTCGS